ncbi:MAG: Hpt domain-containing protein, partial [Methylococcaceae bacterium]|nr:Hpt domain-containing protein [Methylococcaceae bacterium]
MTQISKDLPAETDDHSETLEKLNLGLHLLREGKAVQGDGIFIEPLNAESSIEDFISAIEKLAEQTTFDDLQDACLLLEDALYELSPNEFAIAKIELLSAFNDWSLSNTLQEKSPEPTLTTTFDDVLTVSTSTSHQTTASYIHAIAVIEELANQADAEGYTALQSVSLLLIEALHELSQNTPLTVTSDLPALLDNWATLINAYRQNSLAAIDGIMNIMRHPDLDIPLEEDDFATFKTLLIEELSAKNAEPHDFSSAADESNILNATVIEEDIEIVEPLSAMAQELVELLDTEAGLLNYRFLAVSFDEPIAKLTEHLQLASEELERLTNASTMVGFEGLSEAGKQVNANIFLYLQHIDGFTVDKRDLLIDWVSEVKAYLLAFSKKGAGEQLLAQMRDANWIQPLTPEASAALLPQMQVKGLNAASAEEDNRETVATDDHISLVLPDDVNKELLDLLLQELPIYTQQFSEAIQRLQSGGGSSKDIDVAQRIAHTIKGSANTVGIKGIAVLTHQIEDILMACAKAHKQPGAALMNTLINASDCLEAQCESLLGLGEPPQDAREVLQEVLDWANEITKNGIQDTDNQQAPVKQPSPVMTEVVESSDRDSAPQTPKETSTEKAEPAQVAMVRVPTDQIENLFRLSSESIILNGQIYERQR